MGVGVHGCVCVCVFVFVLVLVREKSSSCKDSKMDRSSSASAVATHATKDILTGVHLLRDITPAAGTLNMMRDLACKAQLQPVQDSRVRSRLCGSRRFRQQACNRETLSSNHQSTMGIRDCMQA